MGSGKGCMHPVLLSTSSASSALGRLARTVHLLVVWQERFMSWSFGKNGSSKHGDTNADRCTEGGDGGGGGDDDDDDDGGSGGK